jgi:hypothetical protein
LPPGAALLACYEEKGRIREGRGQDEDNMFSLFDNYEALHCSYSGNFFSQSEPIELRAVSI